MGLSPCLKFVIGGALTILSWDNPVTAFFRKSKKLRHSLGRPSRSDFVQFQFSTDFLLGEVALFDRLGTIGHGNRKSVSQNKMCQ